MVDVKRAAKAVSKLTMLKFFPSDPNGQTAIVELCCKMAANVEQVEWLVAQVLRTFNEWPGPAEIRKVFASKFRPQDGIAVSVCSCGCGKAHAFALAPNQEWPPRLESAQPAALLEAHKLTPEEQEAERLQLAELFANRKRTPHVVASTPRKFSDSLREMATAPRDRPELPGPTPQIITQEDVDRAVEELRRKRAEGAE